jgi:hypothetical protein
MAGIPACFIMPRTEQDLEQPWKKCIGHTQEATPIQTDNTTVHGIANGTIKQRCTLAMDMQYYRIQDRVKQSQFHFYYRPSADNFGDY